MVYTNKFNKNDSKSSQNKLLLLNLQLYQINKKHNSINNVNQLYLSKNKLNIQSLWWHPELVQSFLFLRKTLVMVNYTIIMRLITNCALKSIKNIVTYTFLKN